MNQIMLMLGLNASGLFGGLKRASDQVKGFERDWKMLGKIFAAGGMTTLILGFLSRLVEHAENSKGKMDENTQAVLRWGQSWESIKGTVMDAGVQAFGTIANWVEKGTIALASYVYGIEAATQALEEQEAAAAKIAEEARLQRIAEAEAQLAKARRDREMASADAGRKLAILINEEITLKEKVRALEGDRAAQLGAINELEAKQTEIKKLNASLTDEEAKKAEKLRAERRQEVEENLERLNLEAKFLAGRINPEEMARLEILRLQSKQRIIDGQIMELHEKGFKNLTVAERSRLNTLIDESGQLGEQIKLKTELIGATNQQAAAEEKVADAIGFALGQLKSYVAEWTGFQGSIRTVGRGDRELSDRELARKISNIKDDIANREARSTTNGAQYDFFLGPARSNLSQAEAEQRFREEVRRQVQAFGADRAFDMFPGLTEQRFDQIMRGSVSQQERLTTAVETLARHTQAIPEVLKSLR